MQFPPQTFFAAPPWTGTATVWFGTVSDDASSPATGASAITHPPSGETPYLFKIGVSVIRSRSLPFLLIRYRKFTFFSSTAALPELRGLQDLVASLMPASWNQIETWLLQIDGLDRTA